MLDPFDHRDTLRLLAELPVRRFQGKVDGQAVATPGAAAQALRNADLASGVLLQVATPQGGVNYVLVKSGR